MKTSVYEINIKINHFFCLYMNITTYIYTIKQIKRNIMTNLNDIFNSDFFQTNIQTQMDADDKHLAENGWTREEIQSIADSVTK